MGWFKVFQNGFKVGDKLNNNNRWSDFNKIVDTLELDIKEKGLLLILFRHVNYKTGYADPSRDRIKKLYGTKKNDVLDKVMNSLIEKGFLVRETTKGKRSRYFIKVGTQIEPSTKIEPSAKIEPRVGTQIEPQKEKEKKTKEKIYINLNFIDDVIDKVEITQEEYNKLVDKFGKSLVNNQVLALDNYISNGNGSKYKNHYKVLNNWCTGKSAVNKEKNTANHKPSALDYC